MRKKINKANYRNSYRRILFLHFFYIQNKTLLIHKKNQQRKLKKIIKEVIIFYYLDLFFTKLP